MRTSRPSGISQENRSHPFFILLRRFSDDQKLKSMSLTSDYLKASIKILLPTFIPLILMIFNMVFWVPTLAYLCIAAFMILIGYFNYRRVIETRITDIVDNMIYSDEYQYQALNNEQLINSMNDCTFTNGRMDEYQYTLHTLVILSIAFLFMLIIMTILFITIMG